MTLAWIPFFEPMNSIQSVWYVLLIPMAFGIAVVYKALREITYATYWRCVLVMTAQIVCGIAAIAFAIGIFVQFVIPHLNSP